MSIFSPKQPLTYFPENEIKNMNDIGEKLDWIINDHALHSS